MGFFRNFFKTLLEPTPTNYAMTQITELPDKIGEQVLTYKYTDEISVYEGLSNHNSIMKYISLNIGREIYFVKEPSNPYDKHAIKIFLGNKDIGYVYRGKTQNMINGWIKKNNQIFAFISGYHNKHNNIVAEYTIGFYTSNGRNQSPSNTLKSKKVNFFTKKWSSACCKQFIALDFETTGLNHNNDRIVEVAALKYENGFETEKFVTLINPKMRIPKNSIAVHHITDEMVKEAPDESIVIPQLIAFLSDNLIVGHNINFDIRFLEAAADRLGLTVQYNYIDTLDISRKFFPDLCNHKLETVSKVVGFKSNAMHRSETDVKACAKIIDYAINNYE